MSTAFLSSYGNTSGSLEEQEMLLEHEPQASISTAFSSSPKLSRVFYNSIETRRTCFIFLLKNTVRRKRKQLVNFDYQIVNYLCSRHHCVKQLELVLCLHRVIAARFLTNQRAYFLRTVF